MNDLQNLPPGWDSRWDEQSGKYYFINHSTKTTTWEDPRNRFKPLQSTPRYLSSGSSEYIPLQHGSPDLRRNSVYPSQPSPIQAFQMPSHMSPKNVTLQDMKPKMSPLSVRSAKIQDSSLTTVNSDEAVAKIAAMFPTVPETHIKMLLKNCRYMKSVFPNADETVILEILQNNDNNIQKTSDALKEMGYSQKDTLKIAQQKLMAKKEDIRNKEEAKIQTKPPTPQPKIKTAEEKKEMRIKLQEKYKEVPEHLITIALESVNFDETRANQILQIMIQEDTQEIKKNETPKLDPLDAASTPVAMIPISQSRQSLKSLLKTEKEVEKLTYSRVIQETNGGYKSQNLQNTKGPNPEYAKGTNENLLLEDYVKWQGPSSNAHKGSGSLAKGPNKQLLLGRTYQACGPNKNNCKGPQFGLAKGSIFSQLKTMVIGESRVK